MSTPQADRAEDETNLRTTALPTGLIYVGVVVGLLLTFVGIGLLSLGRGSILSSLMTCVGFGLVLASFGSTAKGSWAGWTVTGAGALSIVLFLVLQHYQPSTLPSYKKGQLRGDLARIADLRIIDDLPMYAYRDRTTSSIRFVLLEKRLRSNRLSIQVDTTERGDGREFFEIIGNTEAIQRRYLADDVDAEKTIQWTFDYNNRVVKDGNDVIFSEQDRLLEPSVPSPRSGLIDGLKFAMSTARAQTAQPASPVQVSDLISKLKSDDTSERRNARDALSILGPASVAPMMSALRATPDNYRTKLGVLYAMSEMLRHDPGQRNAVSAALAAGDFPLLVSAASDDDKTIRYQAAGFLYLLQDPRAVPSSVEAAKSTSDENKATNQTLIIRQSAQSLSPQDKEKLFKDLTAPSGANNAIVKNLGSLQTFGW
jgi:hypothetical protein